MSYVLKAWEFCLINETFKGLSENKRKRFYPVGLIADCLVTSDPIGKLSEPKTKEIITIAQAAEDPLIRVVAMRTIFFLGDPTPESWQDVVFIMCFVASKISSPVWMESALRHTSYTTADRKLEPRFECLLRLWAIDHWGCAYRILFTVNKIFDDIFGQRWQTANDLLRQVYQLLRAREFGTLRTGYFCAELPSLLLDLEIMIKHQEINEDTLGKIHQQINTIDPQKPSFSVFSLGVALGECCDHDPEPTEQVKLVNVLTAHIA